MDRRIEDYGLIGDTQTAALVGRDGSIDWLCLPRFDSAAIFAALLGTEDHGRWRLAPAGEVTRTERRYQGDDLVLETTFHTADGTVRIIDFMPVRGQSPDIVRIVEGVHGAVPMRMDMTLRFEYGSVLPWVRQDGNALVAIAGPTAVWLRTPVQTRGENFSTVADFTVEEGDRIPFVLTWRESHKSPPKPVDPERALRDTTAWWAKWLSRGTVPDSPWAPLIRRSLITLKALTYAPTGGIVAAPTTSLPEQPGGVRNWDYRFCWLRDATMTLQALMYAGFAQEAEDWHHWLLRAIAGDPAKIQIMYGVAGERRLSEYVADWLPGFDGHPVRIGNAAVDQFQLDVYGEVMDALYQARLMGSGTGESTWALQRALMGIVAQRWQEPDEGIWEVRGDPQHFTHSKLMAWVAADRAVKSVEKFGVEGPVDDWRALREEIREDILQKGWDSDRSTFTQYYGSEELDAALLMIPLVGFLPADDDRVRGTVAAIEKGLLIDGFVRRYTQRHDIDTDGLPPGEGAFLACTFWLADNYVLMGRTDEARQIFDRLTELCNDLGLLSEEYDPVGHRMLGNFPQAFSHVPLINTARTLAGGHTHQR
ncbi:glycoside hydrolase family 15 protein [Nakamurella sp. YIM 132087]|uniref:Trehalase n=1 Tax=Nakamurella alba TaxID=2665158 RepID=A0A7K1FEX5_9ACTN|nr:glycoside hydrolase family 15 protein [Nakamurella alba]